MPGVQRFVWSAAALALGILGLYFGQALLIPVALAAVLALALTPPVSWLHRRGCPRRLAVGMVMALAMTALATGAAVVATQVVELGQELPTHRQNIQKKLRAMRPVLTPSATTRELTRLMDMVSREVETTTSAIVINTGSTPPLQPVTVEPRSSADRAVDWIVQAGLQLATAALVLVLTVLMLVQRAELNERLLRLLGGDRERMDAALSESGRRVSRYLATQVMVSIGHGVPLALGLWAIGVPGAWLWGALGTLLRFVPYLGPALGALCPLVMAFAVDPGWSMVLWTLGLILLLELVTNNLVEPLAYGGSTGVSPLAVLLAAAFWALLWGPVGLVLATPLTACLVVIGRHMAPLRFLDTLFSSEPLHAPAARP
jgi:predicted PurR-regulated permease PerM